MCVKVACWLCPVYCIFVCLCVCVGCVDVYISVLCVFKCSAYCILCMCACVCTVAECIVEEFVL